MTWGYQGDTQCFFSVEMEWKVVNIFSSPVALALESRRSV
jgi:hypothetical protein